MSRHNETLVPAVPAAWFYCVIPLGTGVVFFDLQLAHGRVGNLSAFGEETVPPLGGNFETGLGAGAAQKAQHDLPRAQGLTRPVDADRSEQAMLHWIPLGCSRRVVAHGDVKTVAVGHQLLQALLPQPRPVAVAATGVSQNQQFAGVTIAVATNPRPP